MRNEWDHLKRNLDGPAHGCMSADDGGPCPICFPRPADEPFPRGITPEGLEVWLRGEASYLRELERRQKRDWATVPVEVLF